MITISEVMTPDPYTLDRYQSMADARKLMREKKIRHIPIVDADDKLVGLVSHRNLVANAVPYQDFANEHELAEIESGILLEDIMTKNVVSITPDYEVSKAAEIVHRNKFGCLPVVDKDNRVIGIITDHDFVAITLHLLELMNDMEPPEIDD